MIAISFFTLLFSYLLLGYFCLKQDSIFSHILLVIYSMLSATVTITTVGLFTTDNGGLELLGGAWLIALCFLFSGFVSLTRIFQHKIRRDI